MPENPIYDPNKIVKRAYTTDSYDSSSGQQSSNGVPTYDTSKIVKRGYAPRESDFQEEGFAPEKYASSEIAQEDNIESTLDFIQNKMPGLRNMRDDEKDILRSIMKNPNATKEDISKSIRTFKGVSAEQVYNQRGPIRKTAEYYMDVDDKGVYKPIPIGEYKPLPAGKNIASVWGTGAEAQDDSWYTDLAKKAFNIIPSAMEGVTDFVAAASSDLRKIGTKIEGKEYEKTDATMAAEEAGKFFQQFKFPTSEEYNQQIYDAEGVKNFEDLISKDRVNLSLKNVYGTVSNLAGSVGEMLLTGGAAAEGALAAKTAMAAKVKGIPTTLTKAEKYASVYTGSFITNLGEGMDAAKKAGISDEDAGSFALAVTTPIAFLDAGLGIGGKILSNKLANEGKKELFENLASRVVKDEFGNITEESLKKASSEAVKAYTPIAKSISKLAIKDVLEQGSEEALQSFMSSAGEQLYDKLSDADKAKFGTDAFSAESFGKYISEGVAGLIGSGPLAVKTAKSKQQELYKAQSNSAYETVMQGGDAVKAFRTNVTNSFEKGEISKDDYDNAILKINTYDSYEKTTKDLTLDNDNKKKLFELSLQKENLKAAIKDAESKDTEGHSRLDKMNPAELGLHNAKVKQAKALQDEIDLIVTKSEVLQQPEVAEKVVEKVVKAEEKATEGAKAKEGVSSEIGAILGRQYKVKTPASGEIAVPGKAAYEVPKKVLEETRKMKEIPAEEWNQPTFDVTVKQAKLAEALDETPEKTTTGTLQIDNEFTDDKGRQVQTFNITLPNGKAARFASSMVRFPEENAAGGFRGNTYEENLTNKENPVGQKLGITVRTLKDSGRKVIFVWNADEGPKFGKHIGMVKERLRGKSEYGAADLDEMADLRMINMGQNPNAPAPGIITPEGPTKGGPKVVVPIITTTMRKQLKGLKYSKADVQAMTPQEAADIIKEQREKPKPKTELKEVEIKEKKAAAKANEAKRKAEINAIIAEDKKKTGGAYITRTAAAKIDEVNARYAALENTATTPTDLEALKQTPEGKKIEEERKEKLKQKTPISENIKLFSEKYFKISQYGQILKGLLDYSPLNLKKVYGHGITRGSLYEQLSQLDSILKTGFGRNSTIASFASQGTIPGVYTSGSIIIATKGEGNISDLSDMNADKMVIVYDPILSGLTEFELIKNNNKNIEFINTIEYAKKYLKITDSQIKETFEEKPYDPTKGFRPSGNIIKSVTDTDITKEGEEVDIINAKYDEKLKALEGTTKTNEEKIADLRAQEQAELKREIPNIDKYKVDGKVDENLIKDPEDLKKYKKIWKAYDKKISPLLGKEPTEEKGKAVAEKTPKILVKKEEMDKMLEGKTVPVEEGMSPKEYIRDVLSESENAGQIAEAYLMADEKIEAGDFNSKYDVIYLFFASGKRLSRESLGKQYDDKFINRKDLPGLYSYTVKEGGYPISTDSITQFDDTITPQDVANFIADFPNGYTEYEKIIEDSTRTKLATKFRKIANRNLTPNLAKEVYKGYIEKEKQKEEKDYFSDSMLEEELTKEEYRRQAEEGGYYQKAKVKPATLNKFEKSVDLFYKTKDADGASKKRSLAAERREFLEKNPTVKYIDDNMKYIYKQLEDQNIIERKGECP